MNDVYINGSTDLLYHYKVDSYIFIFAFICI